MGEPVLIVDDNPINLKLARVTLAAEGYQVQTAVDADSVLVVLKNFRPKLILMDLQLPGVDGFELTRRLKSDPTNSSIVIIAFTALAMKGDEERARAAGCDGYITKPVDSSRLAHDVARHLATGAAGTS